MEPDSNHNNLYTAADIRRYLNGQMPPEEMHALEKAALEDNFLQEAIEGYAVEGTNNTSTGPDYLHSRLQERISRKNNVAPLRRMGRWSVAAAVLLVATAGTIAYFVMRSTGTQPVPEASESVAGTQRLPGPAPADSTPQVLSAPIAMNDRAKKQLPATPPVAARQSKAPENDTAYNNGAMALASASRRQAMAGDSLAFRDDAANPVALNEVPAVLKKASRAKDLVAGEKSREVEHTFSGKITNNLNKPVPEASVLVLNTQLAIETDSNGYFNFTLPDTTAFVAFSATGYQTVTSRLKAREAGTHITLKAAGETADEHTAPAPGARSSRQPGDTLTAISAVPAGGWPAFERYIEKNKNLTAGYGVHGTVVLSFTIAPNGRPADVHIVQPADKILGAEATRLLVNGPPWQPGFEKVATQTVTIKL